MKHYTIKKMVMSSNEGINREWALCRHYGIIRTAHDSGSYDTGSDIETGYANISVKASAFTLMSGSLCEGLETFNEIWALYKSKVHSDTFAYITKEYEVYEMNLNEFEKFVFAFCKTERESEKNGGQMKIRCRKESEKMLRWLNERAA